MITLFLSGAACGLFALAFFPKGISDVRWWLLMISLNLITQILMGTKS